MSDKHPSNSSEEGEDNRNDKESYLDRAERLQAERVEFGKELDQRIADLVAADERRAAEFDRQQAKLGKKIEELAAEDRKHHTEIKEQQAKNDKQIEKLSSEGRKYYAEIKEMQAENATQQAKNDKQIESMVDEAKKRDQQIGGLTNKFGRFTEGLAAPSIRKILDEVFDADFRPELGSKVSTRLAAHHIDAWGVARNGAKEVYLIEVKSRFRPGKHFRQILEQVENFRTYAPEYADHEIYPMVGVVDASEQERLQIWLNGMYVIDVAEGVFSLAESPRGFKPKGSHGMNRTDGGGGTSNCRMVPSGLPGGEWLKHGN